MMVRRLVSTTPRRLSISATVISAVARNTPSQIAYGTIAPRRKVRAPRLGRLCADRRKSAAYGPGYGDGAVLVFVVTA